MNTPITPPVAVEVPSTEEASVEKTTRRQIRGSSMFFAGRLISMAAGFIIQVLTVRYLTKSDYGAFAYALSVVLLGRTIITLSLDVAIARFLPTYYDQKDYNKLFGSLVLLAGIVLGLGMLIFLLTFSLRDVIAQSVGSSSQSFMLTLSSPLHQQFVADQVHNNQQMVSLLLVIMILLAPIQTVDTLLSSLFAVFSRPRSIFFRKYVIAPALELLAVVLLVVTHSTVYFLAAGYVIAAGVGMLIYGSALFSLLHRQGLLKHFNRKTLNIPAREILFFAIPMLTTDLVPLVMNSLDAVILGGYHDTASVAALRAVQPVARLNTLILLSFSLLFATAAGRIFARSNKEEINNFYWQNTIWIMIFSFPMFALTFSFAQSATVFLFDVRYQESGIILALLSLGYYFNAATGQNGKALQIFGQRRYVVITDLLSVGVSVGLNLLLIPPYGALGGAIGTMLTMMIYNAMKQFGLRKTGIRIFDSRFINVYISVIAATIGLLLIQGFVFSSINFGSIPPVFPGAVLVGLISLLLLRWNRKLLNVDQVFPELLRIPGVRWFLSV